MLPGPDTIIACPHCGLARHRMWLSGSSFGAIVWSDGKRGKGGDDRPAPRRGTGGAVMGRSCFAVTLAVLVLCGLFANRAAAHPASGIVANAKGEVCFVHTGKGVGKIDAQGELTYIHKVRGGGHFLAPDAEGRFSTQLPRLFERVTPKGVKPALLYASG